MCIRSRLEMPKLELPETWNLWRCVMHVPFHEARYIPISSHLEVFSCQAKKELKKSNALHLLNQSMCAN